MAIIKVVKSKGGVVIDSYEVDTDVEKQAKEQAQSSGKVAKRKSKKAGKGKG